jgi:hypothetical protein
MQYPSMILRDAERSQRDLQMDIHKLNTQNVHTKRLTNGLQHRPAYTEEEKQESKEKE